ncbi:M48 family metalloprotease [Actinoplanes sp. HUAS TT8]|uniref:M48 family metalloprotease n=1 Tax=Actinoplanes sp. HUAS TT8 TaxID=3447453 RepID=UPI003F51E2E8
MFAGQTSYDATRGNHRKVILEQCATAHPVDLSIAGDTTEERAYLRCVNTVDYERVGSAAVGVLAVLLSGVLLMLVLPYRLLWRARPLVPAEAEIAGRAASAADFLGMRQPPKVFFGNWRLHEPFTARALRGIRIILPRGLRRLPPEQVDAVLRHETAHVRAGDVTLVWLTRGVRWALIPALLTPLFLLNKAVLANPAALVEAPLPVLWSVVGHAVTVNYSLRALLLLAVAAILSAAALRSREHEADLAAAEGGAAGLLHLLSDGPAPRHALWHRLLAVHPTTHRRVAMLTQPHRISELRLVDAAAAGLLAGIMIPGFYGALPAYDADGWLPSGIHLTGVTAGVVLASVWGTTLWRATLIAEHIGLPTPLRTTSTTLAVATAAGLLAGFSERTIPGQGIFDSLIMLALLPPSVGAAAAASGLLARAWARGAVRAPVAGRTWVAIGGLNTLLFSGALWISWGAFPWVHSHGWVAGLWVGLGSFGFNYTGACAVVGLCVLALRWTRHRPRLPLIAVLVLLPAAAALVVRWLVITHPTNPPNVLLRDSWAMAAAGGTVVAYLLVRRGADGLITAMAIAPASTFTVAAAIWLRFLHGWESPAAQAGIYFTATFAVLAPVYLLAALVTLVLPYRLTLPSSPATPPWNCRWRALGGYPSGGEISQAGTRVRRRLGIRT